jgi:hypothetical protein
MPGKLVSCLAIVYFDEELLLLTVKQIIEQIIATYNLDVALMPTIDGLYRY